MIRLLIGFLGLLLIGLIPWIWQVHPLVAYLLLLPLIPWTIWLMFAYLKWARGLGK